MVGQANGMDLDLYLIFVLLVSTSLFNPIDLELHLCTCEKKMRTLHLLLLTFFWAVCTAQQEFQDCISRKSKTKFDSFVYTSNSSKYSDLLQNAQRNGRWLNSSTSAKPLLIATPNVDADVQAIVICSKETGLQIRVKSGGHDYEGLSYRGSVENKFVMIDLRNLKRIDINMTEETAWIQAGVTMGELYYAIYQKSKVHAFAGGVYPTIGSGGHISGGGQGAILRKYGLAADNVVDARLVDVNGTIHDKKSMGEDLFWAIRGGGGSSFGVILAWKLKLSRVPEEVTVFNVRRKFDADAFGLLQKWQNISYQLPEDIFTRALIQNKVQPNVTGEDQKIVQVVSYQGLFLGKAKNLEKLLEQKLPEFELKANDCLTQQQPSSPSMPQNCTSQPCVRKECFQVSWIQSALYFAGQSVYRNVTFLVDVNTVKLPPNFNKGKSDFLTKPIPNEGLEIIQKAFLEEDSPIIILDAYGGKMSRIAEDETPFPHRAGSIHNVQYLVNWNNNSQDGEVEKHLKWIRDLYKKMKPYVSSNPRSAYLNYRDLDLGQNNKNFSYGCAEEWGKKYFKGNFARLAKIKSIVDPNNFFRNEQSIPPLQE